MTRTSSRPGGPGLRNQAGTRSILRVLGLVLTPVGVVLVGLGIYRFATFDGDAFASGAPDGFFMFLVGGLVTVLGFGLLNLGFMGTAARYGAGETMPVVKDSAAYLTDGEGVLGVGRTVDDGGDVPARAATGPYCRSCGVRNDDDAKFCDGCGAALA